MPAAEPPADHAGSDGRTPLDFGAIAAAAIRLADAGGMDAVSMRRVAAELGSGTMSLYRHIESKERLYALMCDTVFAAEEPPARTGDWRADLKALAENEFGVYRRHPWMLDTINPPGPGTLRRVEDSLALLAPTGLAMDEIMGVLGVLAGTVHAAVRNEQAAADIRRTTGMDVHEWHASRSQGITELLGSGQYPMFVRMITETRDIDQDAAFRRDLDIVVDGVASLVARKGTA